MQCREHESENDQQQDEMKDLAYALQHPPHQPEESHRRLPGPGALDLLVDAGCLAGQIAQVIKLGTTHRAAALDAHLADRRTEGLEYALHALAVRDLAYGERG